MYFNYLSNLDLLPITSNVATDTKLEFQLVLAGKWACMSKVFDSNMVSNNTKWLLWAPLFLYFYELSCKTRVTSYIRPHQLAVQCNSSTDEVRREDHDLTVLMVLAKDGSRSCLHFDRCSILLDNSFMLTLTSSNMFKVSQSTTLPLTESVTMDTHLLWIIFGEYAITMEFLKHIFHCFGWIWNT